MSESSNARGPVGGPQLLSNHYDDVLTPSVAVEVDPLEADRVGFFHEKALSVADAWDANKNLSDAGKIASYPSMVTAAVVHQLKGGTAPWMRAGAENCANLPYNPISRSAYHGSNAIWLAARADALGYSDPRWMTSGQAEAIGSHVRRGEAGTPIQFWQEQGLEPVRGEDGQPILDGHGRPMLQMVQYERPRVFSAVVFNGEQIEGLPRVAAVKLGPAERVLSEDRSSEQLEGPIGSDGWARVELQRHLLVFLSGQGRDRSHESPLTADVAMGWIGLIERDPHEIFRAAARADVSEMPVAAHSAMQDRDTPPINFAGAGAGFPAEAGTMPIPTLIPRDHPAMAVTEDRTYLAVPYAEKDDAKALGAQWDRQTKAWFVPAGVALDAFQPWLPVMGQVHIAVDSDPRAEFAQALRDAGLRINGVPQMDGSMQRVPAEGDRGPERSGAYVGHLDGRPAGFIQNFRTGVRMQWKASGPATPLDALDRAQMAAEAAQRRHDRAIEREKQYERVAQEVEAIWTAAIPVDAHPYLAAKGVPSHGLRQGEDGRLLVPIQDADGKIWSLQHIARGGMKHFYPEARLEGGHFIIGDTGQAGPLLIAEGYVTAASVHALTGQPTVVAFTAGNLLPVAEAYRSLFPERVIYITGDNDHRREAEGKPNVGAQKSEQAAATVGGFAILPSFAEHEAASDWNDLVQLRGFEHAKTQIQVGLAIAERELYALATPPLDEPENGVRSEDPPHPHRPFAVEQPDFER